MALETETVLVLSTAHITKETSDLLNDKDSDLRQELVVCDNREYGWFIRIFHDEPLTAGLPEELTRCVELAFRTDHNWLLIDQAGPVEDFLTTYEW